MKGIFLALFSLGWPRRSPHRNGSSLRLRRQVQADGSLDVTERIVVRAEGSSIRRGIYRDFPTPTRTATATGLLSA